MFLSAAERAAQIAPAGVTWMSEEENLAEPATAQQAPELRLALKDRAQDVVVLQDERGDRVAVIPARLELEESLDFYDRKARVPLMLLRSLSITLVYQTASSTSRGMARVFSSPSSRPPPGRDVLSMLATPRPTATVIPSMPSGNKSSSRQAGYGESRVSGLVTRQFPGLFSPPQRFFRAGGLSRRLARRHQRILTRTQPPPSPHPLDRRVGHFS